VRALALALVPALCALACGPADVSGTVGGQSIDSSDAIASKSSIPIVGGEIVTLAIGGDSSDLCADFAAGVVRKESSRLDIAVTQLGSPLQLGAYQVGKLGTGAMVRAVKLDSGCGQLLDKVASDGSVTITAIDTDGYEGTFLVSFDGEQLSGSFAARLCARASVDKTTCE
jgi:hypothetical protein